jgi:YfiH family protein
VSFYLDSAGILRLEAWREIPWLLHGFTTRRAGDFGNGTPDGESLRRLGAEDMRLRTVRQIHSNRVCLLTDDSSQDGSHRPEADAMVTARAGHILAVRTADCVPLLLVDRGRRVVATVHAGWRGTQQRIAAYAVERMNACFGSEPKALEAAIGPGIGACCFEVGPEVAEQFDPSLVVSPFRDATPPANIPAANIPEGSRRTPRPHVDLLEANRQQLLEQGIPACSIWSSGRCTCCDSGDFFSYRRDRDGARMLAFIGVTSA